MPTSSAPASSVRGKTSHAIEQAFEEDDREGSVNDAYVVGYDPGGKGNHGVAVVTVREQDLGRWTPNKLDASAERTLGDATRWILSRCEDGPILAVGIDTLTEWNAGEAGWRPADLWLLKRYPAIRSSVIAPNSLRGAMPMNGAAFLLQLKPRFRRDRTMVTETHPKACYHACTREKYDWSKRARPMTRWLLKQFVPASCRFASDHESDAAMSALAALRGLAGDWTLDLHNLPSSQLKALRQSGAAVRFVERTRYWWPDDAKAV